MSGGRTTPPWQSMQSLRLWQVRQYLSSRPAWRMVAPERRPVGVDAAQRARRHQRPRAARRHRRRADELRLQPPVRLGEVAGRAARGRLLAVVTAEAGRHHRQIRARHRRLLHVRAGVAERAGDAARRVQLVVELQVRARQHDPRRLGRACRRAAASSRCRPASTWQASQRAAPCAVRHRLGRLRRDRSCGSRGRPPRAGSGCRRPRSTSAPTDVAALAGRAQPRVLRVIERDRDRLGRVDQRRRRVRRAARGQRGRRPRRPAAIATTLVGELASS